MGPGDFFKNIFGKKVCAFCGGECGKPKPQGASLYKYDKCGWTPSDPTNPPKFCPECGDIFDDSDKQ